MISDSGNVAISENEDSEENDNHSNHSANDDHSENDNDAINNDNYDNKPMKLLDHFSNTINEMITKTDAKRKFY